MGEEEANPFGREVRVRDPFREHDEVVSVLAGQHRTALFKINVQVPDLECFGGDSLFQLPERDLVDQPVGAGSIRDILGTVGEEDSADQAVTMPLFRAGELCQLGFVEGLVCHDFSSFDDGPHCGGGGAKGGSHKVSRHAPNTGAQRMERAGVDGGPASAMTTPMLRCEVIMELSDGSYDHLRAI